MFPLLPGAAGLVIIYKRETTNDEIESFLNNVLFHPREDGRGYDPLPALKFYGRESKVPGYDLTSVAYHPYATAEERENVKQASLRSPIVYKVLEGNDPS